MGKTQKKATVIGDPLFKHPFAFGKYYLYNILFYAAATGLAVFLLRPFEAISYWWILSLVPLFMSRIILILAGWLALSAITLYQYWGSFDLLYLCALPLVVYLGALSAALIHNAAHYNFKPRWINACVGELCALQQLSAGFPVWRAMHFQHHAHPDDPHHDVHPPAGLSFYQFINHSRALVGRWLEFAHVQLWGDTEESRRNWKRQELLMLLARFSKVTFLFVLLGPFYFCLFYLPSYVANVLFLASFNYFTHAQKDDGSVEMVNLDDKLYYKFCNRFLFGVFWHKNHHLKPKLFNPRYLNNTSSEGIGRTGVRTPSNSGLVTPW